MIVLVALIQASIIIYVQVYMQLCGLLGLFSAFQLAGWIGDMQLQSVCVDLALTQET